MNRVHPEQNNKAVKKRVVMMPKIHGPSIVNTIIHPASADFAEVPITTPPTLSLVKRTLFQNYKHTNSN